MFAGHFDFSHPLVWTVDGVLEREECLQLLSDHAQGPWLAATVNAAQGRVVDESIRNNELALVDAPQLAARLLERLRPELPVELMNMSLSRLKPRMRCYRYGPGQRFAPHGDQSYAGEPGERSLLTLMIYLNEDFHGGETAFLDLEQVVEPRCGRALLFQHMVLHEGREVLEGTKYVLRTDVFYREKAAGTELTGPGGA